MLRVLYEAHHQGNAVTLRYLRRHIALGFEDLEEVLESLADIQVAQPVQGGGWVASRGPEAVRVSEIFRCFVISPEGAGAGLPPALAELLRRCEFEVPLSELFASPVGKALS